VVAGAAGSADDAGASRRSVVARAVDKNCTSAVASTSKALAQWPGLCPFPGMRLLHSGWLMMAEHIDDSSIKRYT
jgi:hypothetical protein